MAHAAKPISAAPACCPPRFWFSSPPLVSSLTRAHLALGELQRQHRVVDVLAGGAKVDEAAVYRALLRDRLHHRHDVCGWWVVIADRDGRHSKQDISRWVHVSWLRDHTTQPSIRTHGRTVVRRLLNLQRARQRDDAGCEREGEREREKAVGVDGMVRAKRRRQRRSEQRRPWAHRWCCW